MTTTTKHVLGVGRLSWAQAERIGDRYGSVMLLKDRDSLTKSTGWVHFDSALAGTRGTVVAEVLEARESRHIGDLFRGLFPETPTVGEEIHLGTGEVFLEYTSDGIPTVGLRPDDGREFDWLDPEALYRAHEQTVRLVLEASS